MANRPRRHDLELSVLLSEEKIEEVSSFAVTLQDVIQHSHPKRVADPEKFSGGKDKKEEAEVSELRERLQSLQIVSRAKVTQDRVYSAAYHPEISKDLIFFGGVCKFMDWATWASLICQQTNMDSLEFGMQEHLLTR